MVQSFKCDYTCVAKNVSMCNVPNFIILLMYMAFDEWPRVTTLKEMKVMCD